MVSGKHESTQLCMKHGAKLFRKVCPHVVAVGGDFYHFLSVLSRKTTQNDHHHEAGGVRVFLKIDNRL